MNGFVVDIGVYSGPLDMLLALIERNKLDILDIPIAYLTQQYLDEMALLPPDLESLSAFALMAATLLEIKSKMLLPKKITEPQDEADPREELANRLLLYKQFKDFSQQLADIDEHSGVSLYREPDAALIHEHKPEQDSNLSELLNDLQAAMLKSLYDELMIRRDKRVDKMRIGYGNVEPDIYTIERQIHTIHRLLSDRGRVTFSELARACTCRSETIASFLALLEMLKQRSINVIQDRVFGEIVLEVAG